MFVFCGLFYGVAIYRQALTNQKYIIKLKTGYDPRNKKHLSIKFYLAVYCFTKTMSCSVYLTLSLLFWYSIDKLLVYFVKV